MIAFWVKISEGKTSKLSSIMYNIVYRLHLEGTYSSPWILCIKKILSNSGNPNFWTQQEFLQPKAFMKDWIELQLKTQFLQEWEHEINRNRKCIIYRIFKDEHRFEPYLRDVNFLDRRTLSKFRMGNHKLPVTESRYFLGVGMLTLNANYVIVMMYAMNFILFLFVPFSRISVKNILNKITTRSQAH